MFAAYMNGDAWDNRSHRGWTTLLSFAVQATGIGMLLLIPMLSLQGLPALQSLETLVAPAPTPRRAPEVPNRGREVAVSSMVGNRLMMPRMIPRVIASIDESALPAGIDALDGMGVPGGTGSLGDRTSLLNALGTGSPAIPILAPPPIAKPVRVSHVSEGDLIHRVQPEYPPLARQARIQGVVMLRAIISREGKIENLQTISGHPLLVAAAMAAVKQWRYRPYVLNNQPVEVETQITVNFTLGGA